MVDTSRFPNPHIFSGTMTLSGATTLAGAVTVTGAGLEQVVFSAETTIPTSHDPGHTDIVFPTIPANSVIVDFGFSIGAAIDTDGSSGTTFKVSLGKGGSQTNLMAAKTVGAANTDIAAGTMQSVSLGNLAAAGGAALTFDNGALLASTTAVTDLTARFSVGVAALDNPGGLRAFVKYVKLG